MKQLNLVKGPHVIYTGSNGKETYGITVSSVTHEDGFKATWNINDVTLLKVPKGDIMDKLGLSRVECDTLLDELKSLMDIPKN